MGLNSFRSSGEGLSLKVAYCTTLVIKYSWTVATIKWRTYQWLPIGNREKESKTVLERCLNQNGVTGSVL